MNSMRGEMSKQDNPDMHDQRYTMGYSEEFQLLLRRRSAANTAAHFLPLLKPGMRLLDVGCGPGSISMGLADVVAPGDLIGIDMEETQISLANAAASAGGHSNARFQVGDALNLPFEDNSFDAVHSHAVLMHIPDVSGAAAEMFRVLKPGGLLSCRDVILSSCFFEPRLDDYSKAWDVFGRLLAANGGHPEMGKEFKGLLHSTGFADVAASASFECFSSRDDVEFFYSFVKGWFFGDQTVAAAVKLGLASAAELGRWSDQMDQWRTEAAAFAAISWGEAIGVKPE